MCTFKKIERKGLYDLLSKFEQIFDGKLGKNDKYKLIFIDYFKFIS